MDELSALDTEVSAMPRGRPAFLTVICILSFVGIGLGILQATISLFSAKFVKKTYAQMQQGLDRSERDMAKWDSASSGSGQDRERQRKMRAAMRKNFFGMESFTSDQVNHIPEIASSAILSNLLCLLGVILMWKLRRQGFFIYVIGQVIGWVIPFLLRGNAEGVFGAMLNVVFAFAAIVPVGFIILYAVNLKYMTGGEKIVTDQ